MISMTDEQAKAISATANFGETVVEEGSALTRYLGRILGTVPEDAVGLVIGDPLGHLRMRAAIYYDGKISEILQRRNVQKPEPVSPSLAIPLISAAYDETRPELQQIWAELLAAAMDPSRSGAVRLSFVNTVKQFDPLDALRQLYNQAGELAPNPRDNLAGRLQRSRDEIELSAINLEMLRCVAPKLGAYVGVHFYITTYGRELVRVCSG